MESRRQHKSSDDIFSFPKQGKGQDSEFEFGCVTPDLPSSKGSPADHLFCNGKLLPHVFPLGPASPRPDFARANSRASSISSSRESLFSSRSNSTSSSCSSARTSSSDNSERMRAWTSMQAKVVSKTAITREGNLANRPVLAQPYGNSQRWQFITPAPVLSREPSRRRRAGAAGQDDQLGKKKKKKVSVEKRRAKPGLGWRFFRSFMSACRECHAMEPSRKVNIKSQ